ncbi:FAD-binding protein [Streptomyces sp. NPDC050560]|uniref:FAD-binding protein n=1 Tax=Streptomyces sp. NPDC050560 TaxID=3365630 RepID=UPI0037BA17B6
MPDLVVVGAGPAGLAAALGAADEGARAEVVEGAPEPGGAAPLSNGSLWTFDSAETFLARCPGADPAVARRVTGGLGSVVAWLRREGVTVAERGPSLYGAATSHQVSPPELVAVLAAAVRARAALTTGDPVTGLARDGAGVRVVCASGREIAAGAVVVASGGIHGDPALLRAAGLGHYVGLPVRSRPRGGDGVRLATGLGATLAGTADGIYGHLVPAGLPPGEVTAPLAAQYHSSAGVLLGADGTVVAPVGTDDHHLNRALARTPERRGFLVHDIDAAPPLIRKPVGGASWAADRFAFASEHGARTARADTLGELLGALGTWGLPPLGAGARAAVAGVLRTPPFHAVEVTASITHAGAGLRVDDGLAVAGVRGVFAAGADIGGAFGDGYGGGLALALTTGLAAGRRAAAAARDPRAAGNEETPWATH